jgi:Arc/MetJ-type ribon-helix-helix transcriptional regulator
MASQNDYQLALRIPGELLAAIDAEVERVKSERPGARVQRSDVVREALMRAFFRHPQAMSGIVKRDNETQEPAAAANGSSRGHDDSSH